MRRNPHRLIYGSVVGLSMPFLQAFGAIADELPAPSARGVLRSTAEATLATDMSARIDRLPFQAGQAFKMGDLLISFNCERLEAERRVAEAEARGAKATLENAQHLLAQRAAGLLEVEVAKAQADKTQAVVETAIVKIKPCQQTAPFAGRVVEVLVHEFDTPAINAPLIKIVATDTIEVDLILPSHWLRWARVGTPFTFKIDETGQAVSAIISRLGAVVDPVSQTVRAVGRLSPAAAGVSTVLPGMSGTAEFQTAN